MCVCVCMYSYSQSQYSHLHNDSPLKRPRVSTPEPKCTGPRFVLSVPARNLQIQFFYAKKK